MALVPFPPTHVRFLTSCAKPEAFDGASPGTGIAHATMDQVISQRATRAINIALSDPQGRGVASKVAQIDDGMESIIFALAARDLMAQRGYNRQAGADEEIVKRAEEAAAELEMMAPGQGGKRVTFEYTLIAAAAATKDAIRVVSSPRADGWSRPVADPLRYRP